MADRVESFNPSCGASTAAGATLAFNQGEIVSVDVFIPKGHAGLTSLIVTYGNFQVIPFTPGDSLTGDDKLYSFEIESTPTGSQWGVQMTNSDVYAHSWVVTFYIDEIVPPSAVEAFPILVTPYAN